MHVRSRSLKFVTLPLEPDFFSNEYETPKMLTHTISQNADQGGIIHLLIEAIGAGSIWSLICYFCFCHLTIIISSLSLQTWQNNHTDYLGFNRYFSCGNWFAYFWNGLYVMFATPNRAKQGKRWPVAAASSIFGLFNLQVRLRFSISNGYQ